MFLENKSKGATILKAQGFSDLYLKPGEEVEIKDSVYKKFKQSIDVAVQSFGLIVSDKAPKKEIKEEIKETADEGKPSVDELIEKAKNDVLLAEEQVDRLPEDAHHKTKKAAERRLGKAKTVLESLLGGL